MFEAGTKNNTQRVHTKTQTILLCVTLFYTWVPGTQMCRTQANSTCVLQVWGIVLRILQVFESGHTRTF